MVLSEQVGFARRRVKKLGLEEMFEVLVCDYRYVPLPDHGGRKYDKLVSIEMIGHVRAESLDTYFCVRESIFEGRKRDNGVSMQHHTGGKV